MKKIERKVEIKRNMLDCEKAKGPKFNHFLLSIKRQRENTKEEKCPHLRTTHATQYYPRALVCSFLFNQTKPYYGALGYFIFHSPTIVLGGEIIWIMFYKKKIVWLVFIYLFLHLVKGTPGERKKTREYVSITFLV